MARIERRSEDLPPAARVTMPADWSASLGRGFSWAACGIAARFNKPTGLESGERVFLVVEPPRSRGVVSLGNGKRLGCI